jgi:hypothetical protein
VAYVQVNNASHALKLAAFIVAFFSPFFSHSGEFDNIELVDPIRTEVTTYLCKTSNQSKGSVQIAEGEDPVEACSSVIQSYVATVPDTYNCGGVTSSVVFKYGALHVQRKYGYGHGTCSRISSYYNIQPNYNGVTESIECPSSHPMMTNVNGDIKCYNADELEAQKDKDDECKNFVLDSGNNTAPDMCFTSESGSKSCNVQKVTTDGGGSYYKGVSASVGGCISSEHPPYDDTGTGDKKDDCLYSEGVNYCQANRDKHCSTTVGVEICDDGCIDDGTNLYCDTARHPDVGEGDSNYFDDNGTCSVISASSSRGFCEDNDGVWDETTDYQETSCPAGAGTCSVAVAGLCASCFDAGGTWTPDPSALLSDEAKVGIENQALAKTGNNKLTQIEHGQRKTAEATQSTIKSGNAKVVAAIESLGQKLTEDEEKESFTTTTTSPDKSKINSLFDDASKAALQVEIEQIKTDISSFITTARAEATSLITITVPSSTGYESRVLALSQGNFDLTLGRFDYFFKLLSGPIMFLCSVIAGFILLRKD